MSSLADRVAIVTGASSGIGAATAEALAARGAAVFLAARRLDRLVDLVRRIADAGGRAVAVACDVRSRDDVEALAEAVLDAHGRVDILVNNAGVMPLAPLSAGRVDEWEETIDTNVKGVLYGIAAVLPSMLARKTGHIVNVSSVAGRLVFPTAAVYCASKWAVHAISDGLRSELAEHARTDGNTIRVTIIAPGVVHTELPASIRDEPTRSGFEAYVGAMQHPLTGPEIADTILFALEAPAHVGINELLVRPREQIR